MTKFFISDLRLVDGTVIERPKAERVFKRRLPGFKRRLPGYSSGVSQGIQLATTRN